MFCFLSFFGLVAYLVYRVNGNKCLGIGLFHEVHKPSVFLTVNNGDDLAAGLIIVSADDLIKRGTAVQLVQDEIGDLVELWGDNAHAALDINSENEVIDDYARKISGNNAEDHSLCIVANGGGKSHRNSRKGARAAQIHVQIFIHYLRNDIKPAGGCIAGEKYGHGNAAKQYVCQHVQHLIGEV